MTSWAKISFIHHFKGLDELYQMVKNMVPVIVSPNNSLKTKRRT